MNAKKQQGFGLLIFLLALTAFASAIIFAASNPQTSKQKLLQNQQAQLNQAKQNLLDYLVATPEVYATNTNGHFYPLEKLAAPGYLPCPDTNGDGASNAPCGGSQAIVSGRLPLASASRHFQLQPGLVGAGTKIWYYLDSRYAIQNPDFNNQSTMRFTPLNSQQPGNGILQLNQRDNLVVVLLIASSNRQIELDNPPDLSQINPQDFLAQSISFAEWKEAVLARVARQAPVLCQLAPEQTHWFNACNNPDRTKATCDFVENLPSNPSGANWREILC